MAVTKITDVIVPEVFNPYVIEQTAAQSNLFSSGIIQANPALNVLASSGGRIVNMPFWQDLAGADEVLSDAGSLTVGKIDTAQDKAIILQRGRAFGTNDLAAILAGDDPMAAIGKLLGGYWARRMQDALLKTLEGIFNAGSMSGGVLDISEEATTAAVIDAEAVLDAAQLLGDNKDSLTAIMAHSATVTLLTKLDLIDYVPDSQGVASIKSFLGRRIVEDDSCPVTNGVYTTYLFGAGAVGYGEGNPLNATETARDTLAGDTWLTNRKQFILHPRGVAWQDSSCVLSSPTNVELALAANWARVYEQKNVRIVALTHRNAVAASS
jgi:hypothetical protein